MPTDVHCIVVHQIPRQNTPRYPMHVKQVN